MKPICVPCHRFYRPTKNGRYFLEGMPVGSNVAPGLAEAEKWQPYKLWCGDEWTCRGCGSKIIVGTGVQPISERHESDFATSVERFGAAKFQVNDC